MKNLASLKSLVVAIISVFTLSSCVEEMLYITEEERVEILNNLAYSTGEIKTGTENALIPELTLEQDTILVDEFSELSLESSSSEDFQFSDSQKASLKVSAEGGYTVKTLTYKEYIVEDYSPNKRKITVLFDMDYEYLGELRSVVLSPWYFQETPVKVTPQDPEPVDKVTFNPYQTIKDNGKGTITATFFVDKIVNEQVDTTYKAVVTIAKVGSVSGMEVHTVSTSCTKEDMTCESLSTSEKVVKDFFTTTTEERLYKWETNFTSTTGGKVSPKNEIRFVLCTKVVFEVEGFKHTWTFNGSANDVVRTIEDHGLEGKYIEGTYSPYLGTYVLKVNTYLFSPQIEELDGSTPFFSSTAENHLYQRESVVE
jgi:hypothetical protein